MVRHPELDFLTRFYRKCNLQIMTFDLLSPMDHSIDLRFRESIGRSEEYFNDLQQNLQDLEPHTIYRVMDQYLCCYLFLTIVENGIPKGLSVGPYLSEPMSQEQIITHSAKLGLTPQQLGNYYLGLPVLQKDSPVFAALYVFCEQLWGKSEDYQILDVNLCLTGESEPKESSASLSPTEFTTFKQMVELRYSYENELMQAVARGITLKAELVRPSSFPSFLDSRSPDPVRNIKNYCIIMNTLLRKAAEQGGVHPIHLDEMSSRFARKIEAFTALSDGQNMMDEMFAAYTHLVKKHSVKNYSALIQQAILYIDRDLEGDLSLHTLANALNVNASYLSNLFCKEMGQTITDYITSKRITLAMRLLGTTQMQIQTIAQKCGVPDVNYFTKKFKKATGRTPKEYRHALETLLARHT